MPVSLRLSLMSEAISGLEMVPGGKVRLGRLDVGDGGIELLLDGVAATIDIRAAHEQEQGSPKKGSNKIARSQAVEELGRRPSGTKPMAMILTV